MFTSRDYELPRSPRNHALMDLPAANHHPEFELTAMMCTDFCSAIDSLFVMGPLGYNTLVSYVTLHRLQNRATRDDAGHTIFEALLISPVKCHCVGEYHGDPMLELGASFSRGSRMCSDSQCLGYFVPLYV